MSKSTDLKKKLNHDLENLSGEKSAQPPPPINKPPWYKHHLWDFWRIPMWLLALILAAYTLRQCLKSPSQKYNEANHEIHTFNPPEIQHKTKRSNEIWTKRISIVPPKPDNPAKIFNDTTKIIGIAIPDYIIRNDEKITFVLGNDAFNKRESDIVSGIELNVLQNISDCEPGKISIKVKIINNRLYLSTLFKDIESKQVIASIDYNTWDLALPNGKLIYQDDSTLEIRDNEKNMVCRIKFRSPNYLLIQGYFVGQEKVLVLGEFMDCFVKETQRKNMYNAIDSLNLPDTVTSLYMGIKTSDLP